MAVMYIVNQKSS